jgi:predicted transcriptional regulator
VQRRKQLEIIEEILSACRTSLSRTRIMYRVNLNFQRVNEYIKFLLEYDLIEEKSFGNLKTYKITKKGEEFLSKLQEVKEFLKTKKSKQVFKEL